MSADNLDLSRVDRPAWDMERRYGETRNLDSPLFSHLLSRMVFTPRKTRCDLRLSFQQTAVKRHLARHCASG